MMKNNRLSGGFTLIELMIVVAIIAVLAMVAIPKFANMVNRAREADVKDKLGALRGAINIYYSDVQLYPSDLTVSLTTGAHYIEALPSAQIPAFLNQGNPGHLRNSAETATLDDLATGIWFFSSNFSDAEVLVNCTHFDSKGQVWSGA